MRWTAPFVKRVFSSDEMLNSNTVLLIVPVWIQLILKVLMENLALSGNGAIKHRKALNESLGRFKPVDRVWLMTCFVGFNLG